MNGEDEIVWLDKPIDPWKTIDFLKKNLPKNSLKSSFKDVKLQMEGNEALQEDLVELKKFIKMQFDTFEHLPIGFHLRMADDLSKLADIPFHLPTFPLQPSKNIVDAYIKFRKLGNGSRSEGEKLELYKNESNDVPVVLDTLKAWEVEVENFKDSVAAFKSYHQKSLNNEQNLKITNMEVRATESLRQINTKIAEKKKELKTYVVSFENFYNKLKNDQKFVGMNQTEVRNAIKEIWNNSDEAIRRSFAVPRQCKIEHDDEDHIIVEEPPAEQPSSSRPVVSNRQKRNLVETDEESEQQDGITPKRARNFSKRMESESSSAPHLVDNPNRTVLKSILKKSPNVTKF